MPAAPCEGSSRLLRPNQRRQLWIRLASVPPAGQDLSFDLAQFRHALCPVEVTVGYAMAEQTPPPRSRRATSYPGAPVSRVSRRHDDPPDTNEKTGAEQRGEHGVPKRGIAVCKQPHPE